MHGIGRRSYKRNYLGFPINLKDEAARLVNRGYFRQQTWTSGRALLPPTGDWRMSVDGGAIFAHITKKISSTEIKWCPLILRKKPVREAVILDKSLDLCCSVFLMLAFVDSHACFATVSTAKPPTWAGAPSVTNIALSPRVVPQRRVIARIPHGVFTVLGVLSKYFTGIDLFQSVKISNSRKKVKLYLLLFSLYPISCLPLRSLHTELVARCTLKNCLHNSWLYKIHRDVIQKLT